MAQLLWGNVYYKEHFAGVLREESGGRIVFEYDAVYVDGGGESIAWTLPVEKLVHVSDVGLHPFFDNLVAEGWLERAQERVLGWRQGEVSRLELLLAFGYDCIGAVSVMDPEPAELSERLLDMRDVKDVAAFRGRASLSGVQPKCAVVERGGKYYAVQGRELSTHIAKFPSRGQADLVDNEYLTTQAFRALLPDEKVVDLNIGALEGEGDGEPALIIKRFDREAGKRIPFEEFNQLLGKLSRNKYKGAYSEMSHFILNTKGCLPVENYRLYARILAGFLLGNTDMHFKNFGMFREPDGSLRLTPVYDQVAACLYDYKAVALAMGGAEELPLKDLNAKKIVALGEAFGLNKAAIAMAVERLGRNKASAQAAIADAPFGEVSLKEKLIQLIETRWNGTYNSIGKVLSKKR